MAVQKITHLSIDERRAKGGEARDRTPPSAHANWVPAAEKDYQQFVAAIRAGQLAASEGI